MYFQVFFVEYKYMMCINALFWRFLNVIATGMWSFLNDNLVSRYHQFSPYVKA